MCGGDFRRQAINSLPKFIPSLRDGGWGFCDYAMPAMNGLPKFMSSLRDIGAHLSAAARRENVGRPFKAGVPGNYKII
jgi:hypothetical protein